MKTMSDWIKAGQQQTVDPVDGDVEGVLLGVKEDVGPNGSKMYTIKVGEKQFGMWGRSAIDNQMADVAIGEQVLIKYTGDKVNPKTNRTFKNFDVFHKFPDGSDASAQKPSQTGTTKKEEDDDVPF